MKRMLVAVALSIAFGPAFAQGAGTSIPADRQVQKDRAQVQKDKARIRAERQKLKRDKQKLRNSERKARAAAAKG